MKEERVEIVDDLHLRIKLRHMRNSTYDITGKYIDGRDDFDIIKTMKTIKNINVRCESTHSEILSKVVIGDEADLGLVYDGEADRLIAIDKNGNIIDEDRIIAVLVLGMKDRGELKNNQVVTTVMSNTGFENYLSNKGIRLIRANVGDRYALEKMKELNVNTGREQSEHIISSDFGTTVDGVLTSVKLVGAIRNLGKSLDEVEEEIVDWAQLLINVKVDNIKKNLWNKNEIIVKFIQEKELI